MIIHYLLTGECDEYIRVLKLGFTKKAHYQKGGSVHMSWHNRNDNYDNTSLSDTMTPDRKMGWRTPLSLLLSSWLLNGPRMVAGAEVSACKIPAVQSAYLSSGFGYQGDCVPSNGTVKAFMLFVDFPDAHATEATPQEVHDNYLPGAADWYATSSQGALTLDVTADTAHFVRMPAPSYSYNWTRSLTTDLHYKYIQDAVDAYLNTSSTAKIPAGTEVLYIAPTRNAREISFSPTYMGQVTSRSYGQQRVARKAVTFGLDAYETWGFKVLNHETGHTMCLPDYYPFEAGKSTGFYVGGWSLMGVIDGLAPDWFAWDKWRLGWLPDSAVECLDMGNGTSGGAPPSSTHVLSPLSSSKGTRAVVIARYGQEVLVAEMRTKTGLDDKLCAAPGVLLYTVSSTAPTGEGPLKVLNVNPKSARCAGGELNDATLSFTGPSRGRASSYSVPGWGVKVTVTAQTEDSATIQVDIS
ncbi:M6 metalloprotease [Apiospora arundinis]|uniref:M6 metalloprotease n=1 Tax=Apiospora arundinis TaxID=335852 RepID=A0ABR2HSQ9_9PEZI